MTDEERRKRQKNADEALKAAIEESMKAYEFDRCVLVDWVVIIAGHLFEAEGGSSTVHGQFVADDQPLYRTLGLVEMARHKTFAHGLER
jgi:hypothetical protein